MDSPWNSSVSAGPYPETLLPTLPRRNILQFLISALLRQIQRVSDPSHRLEADKITIRPTGRIDDYRLIVVTERHFNLLRLAPHPHGGLARRVANQIREYMVKRQSLQLAALRLRQKLLDGTRRPRRE